MGSENGCLFAICNIWDYDIIVERASEFNWKKKSTMEDIIQKQWLRELLDVRSDRWIMVDPTTE